MKPYSFAVLFFIFFFLLLTLSSSFADRIPLAVYDLEAQGVPGATAAIVTDVVRSELRFCGKYELIEKARMQEVLRLQGFQQTGCTEVECAAKLGKILNVKKMVVGGLGKLGDSFRLSLRVVDVETAVIETEGSEKQALKEDDLDRLVPVLVSRLFCPEIKRPETVPPLAPTTTQESMIEIPAGEFAMGSNDANDQKPIHKVYLDAYYIDKYEVTVGQFRKFCSATGNSMPDQPSWNQGDNYPVVKVTWEDASSYASWAGKRLPTEAEWEKAARGPEGRKYPWGDSWDANKCNNGEDNSPDGYANTSPVGSFPQGASPYGVMDMAGNVWEWCADWYDKNYYKKSPSRNPTGPSSGSLRVLRGGAWDNSQYFCRSVDRHSTIPQCSLSRQGFRCVR